jgi:hypothetical protein
MEVPENFHQRVSVGLRLDFFPFHCLFPKSSDLVADPHNSPRQVRPAISTPESCSWLVRANEIHHGVEEALYGGIAQRADGTDHERRVGSEQLARAREAGDEEATRCEVRFIQGNRPRVAVGVAGHLAHNPIATPGVGQANGGPNLGL